MEIHNRNRGEVVDKTLFLLNFVGNGGTEKYVYDLITARGPERCILVYSEEGPGISKFEILGVKIIQVSMRHPFDIKASFELKKVIKQEKVTVVHAQFLRENYIGVLAKLIGAPIKVLWTYHVDVEMKSHIKFANMLMTKLNDEIIAVSNFMKDQLVKKGVKQSSIHVIYNGVPERQPSAMKRLASDVPLISVIGRLREEKGHMFLIETLEYLRGTSPELKWKCEIYGEGPIRKELETLVTEKRLTNEVQFFGHSEDIEEVYMNTDLVVIPSENEALSYVGIEALSYGIPLIGTSVGGIPEVIEDGVTGYLVEFGDKESLARKIERLLTDKEMYEKFSIHGKRHFATKFKTSTMIDKTFELYDK